jgi:hypothetical protein
VVWVILDTPADPVQRPAAQGAPVGNHWSIGLDVVDIDRRLAAYELHIGLVHVAYNSISGRAGDQAPPARRISRLLDPR